VFHRVPNIQTHSSKFNISLLNRHSVNVYGNVTIENTIRTIIVDLNKCHASVNATKIPVLKKNLGPCDGAPFLYLFLQLIAGFQKLGLNVLNIDV
jgi:hypothetical protein